MSVGRTSDLSEPLLEAGGLLSELLSTADMPSTSQPSGSPKLISILRTTANRLSAMSPNKR